jgi:hypothetical protein
LAGVARRDANGRIHGKTQQKVLKMTVQQKSPQSTLGRREKSLIAKAMWLGALQLPIQQGRDCQTLYCGQGG